MKNEKAVNISFDGLKNAIQKAEGKILSGKKMNSFNSFDKPDEVIAKDATIKITGKDSVEVKLPVASVFSLTVHA